MFHVHIGFAQLIDKVKFSALLTKTDRCISISDIAPRYRARYRGAIWVRRACQASSARAMASWKSFVSVKISHL